MKHTLFTILLILTLGFSAFAKDERAEIKFDSKEYDFGYIKEQDGKVTGTFEFTNTGKQPLIIIEVYVSCGCMNPKYPKRPIEPGKKGVITVEYNPLGRIGAFRKEIKVLTNGKKKRTSLHIIGCTVPQKK